MKMGLHRGSEESKSNDLEMHSSVQCESSDLIVASTRPSIPCVDGITVPELVWSNLHLKEKWFAIECALTGQKWTFGEIFRQSKGFAAALIQIGLTHGNVVSVILPNIPEFFAVIFGVLDAGGIVVLTNPQYTIDEMIPQLTVLKSKFAITTPTYLPIVHTAVERCPTLKNIIVVGEPQEGCHTFSEMVKVDPTAFESSFLKGSEINTRECVAFISFSSGTTGIPKGVQLTHFNVCANAMQYLTPGCGNVRNIDRGEEQDRLIGILPFFHSYGLMALVLSGACAGHNILCVQKFESDTFVKYVRQFKPHVLTLVPPIIAFLVNHPDVTAKDFEQVRCIQSGAAPLGNSLITQVVKKAGKDIFVQAMYGLTETSPGVTAVDPKFGNSKIGACGSAFPDTFLKIIDVDTGKILGPNQKGELCIKGPQVMKGYFENDEATRNTIDSDGWLHSGDVSYYDEDECFYIVDRIKELIKVNGLQVAPAELEDLLRHHPQVADVAVIGIPHEKCGEVPRAYIIRKSEDLTEAEIHAFLNGKITKHKEIQGGVEFVKVIPKAASGKILRRVLKQDFLQKIKMNLNSENLC